MRRIKSHTLIKLKYLEKYVNAYLTATKRLPYKYFVDAFAGTGECIVCDVRCKSRGGKKCAECSMGGKRIDGSAIISLKAKENFTKYFFIELNSNNIGELKKTIKEKINSERSIRVHYLKGDTNIVLPKIDSILPKKSGVLIFLDPEGPELFWDTIVALSKLEKCDLLILYPYDMSLVRLTTIYGNKLDKFFGTKEWSDLYFNGRTPNERRLALLNFYRNNLMKIGFSYVIPKPIKTGFRNGKLLYYLILATHKSVGQKIMSDIFNKELDGQTKMKFK